jgi:hypothetical protein
MLKEEIAVGTLLAFHRPDDPHYLPVAVIDMSTLWQVKVIAGEHIFEPVAGWRCSAQDGRYVVGYLTVVRRYQDQVDGGEIAEDIRAWLPTLPARLTEDAVNALAREMPPTLQLSLESPRYFIETWKEHRAAVDAGMFEAEVQRKRRRNNVAEPSTFVQFIQRRAFSRLALDLSEAVVEESGSVTMPTAALARFLGFNENHLSRRAQEGEVHAFFDSAGVPIRVGDTVCQASASGLRWSHEALGALQVNAGETGTVVGTGRSRVWVDFGRTKKIGFGRVDTGEPVLDTVHPDMLTVQVPKEGARVPELPVTAALVLWVLRHQPGEYTTPEIAEIVSVAKHLVRPSVHRLAEVGLARGASPGRQVKRWALDGSPERADAVLAHYDERMRKASSWYRNLGR